MRASIFVVEYGIQFVDMDGVFLQRNVLRIALQSLGSPLWLDEGGVVDSIPLLPRFLHRLRALLRRAYAVAMVTVPTHLMQVHTHDVIIIMCTSYTCNECGTGWNTR